MVTGEREMARTGHPAEAGRPAQRLKTGTPVTVRYGQHDSRGIIVGTTITGRYTVEVEVEGSAEPVMTSYALDEIRS